MKSEARQHHLLSGVTSWKRNRKNDYPTCPGAVCVLLLALVLQLSTMGVTEAFVASRLGRNNNGVLNRSSPINAHCNDWGETEQSSSEAVVSRRSALLSAAQSASAALLALSIDPSKSFAEESTTQTAKTTIPISASWRSVDGLNILEEENKDVIGFDGKAYQAMINDQIRTPKFYKAIEERIANSKGDITVLDLGTGPAAIFAIKAAELGAKKVYAIEANKEAAKVARENVAKKGFDDIITVLEGFSSDIVLPNEDKVDLVVAEIIGSVASEEGVVATISDAHRRFVKNPTDPKSWIPSRVQTYGAPASYTLHNMFGPPGFDWNKLNGEPVRFSCLDEGLQLLSDPQIVEDINFADILNYSESMEKFKNLQFTVDATRTKDNTENLIEELQKNQLGKSEATRMAIDTGNSFTGIAFWPRLILSETDSGITIDSRQFPNGGHQKSHWQTVLPIMKDRPVPVKGGDIINVTATFDIPSGVSGTSDIKTAAKYKLDGTVVSSSA